MKIMTPAILACMLAACGNKPSSATSDTTTVATNQTLNQTESAGTVAASGSPANIPSVQVTPVLAPPQDTGTPASATDPDATKSLPDDANARTAGTAPVPGTGTATTCAFNAEATCTVLGQTTQKAVTAMGIILTAAASPFAANTPVAAALVSDEDGSVLARETGLVTSEGLRLEFAPQVPLADANGTLGAHYTLYAGALDANGHAQAFAQPLGTLILTGNGLPAAHRVYIMDPYDGTVAGLTAVVDLASMTPVALPACLAGAIDATSFDFTLCEIDIPGPGSGSSAEFYAPKSLRIIDATTGVEVFNNIGSDGFALNGICSRSVQLPGLLRAGGNYTIEVFAQIGDNVYLNTSGGVIQDFAPLSLNGVTGATVVYTFMGNGTPFISSRY